MRLKQIVRTAFVAAMLSTSLFAQATTASIFGRVTDRTGAAVQNHPVTATHAQTNFSRTVSTDRAGAYILPLLPLGTYRVEVTVPGFKKFEQTGVVLEIDRNARVDVALDIGNVSESVSVTADAPLVNTTEPSIGRTVSNSEIISLPLVNRDVYSLLALTAGVDSVNTENQLGSPTITTVVNGSSSGTGSVNYYLDGGNNTSGLRNTGNPAPNPDAVQEFRVVTNSYGAEFGRFAGGVIDVVTKSGSNQLHGSLFEFIRNDKLNANVWGATSKPPLRRNQFGGTLGGPIVPNKVFFFGSYSGLRQREQAYNNSAIVPTELERNGDFSRTTQANGSPLAPIRDPLNANQIFPGNVIPPSRLDPTVQNIMKTWVPRANFTGNRFETTQPRPFDTDEYQGKVDYAWRDNHQINGSYFRQSGAQLETLLGNLPWAERTFQWTQQNYNAGDTWTISESMINQLRLTYVRNYGGRVPSPQMGLGDFGSKFRVQGTPSLPQIQVAGFFNMNNAISGPVAGSNYYGIREVMNINKGSHSLKFGVDAYLEKIIHDTLLNNYGTFSFDGSRSGNALADFMLGTPRSMNQDAPISKYDNGWYYGMFLQDDWRLHPRFTLNLGLRYDLQTPMTDPQDRRITYVAGRQSKVIPNAPAGLLFPGDEGITRGVIGMDKNNFAPRVGFAWDPTGQSKTSVRGGFGAFFGSISGNEWNLMADRAPFAVRQSFPNVNTITDPYATIAGGDPFPYVYSPQSVRWLPNSAVTGISLDFAWPYTYQMNLSVQHQISSDISVSAAYVGSLAHKLPFQRDLNYPLLTSTATTANINNRRPILPGTLSNVYQVESIINTTYHGLQFTGERRMGRQFTFKGYYTFSKALDGLDLQQSNVQVNVQNHSRLDLERARTASDRRHNFVMSAIWEPKYFTDSGMTFAHWALDGWAVSSIVTARSGAPITITSGRDVNLDGNNTDRAHVVGDPNLSPDRDRNAVANMWFNTAAFVVPANGVDGNASRNLLDGPGLRNVDLGLFRNFNIRERMNLQFRSEITNALNLVSLNNPTTAMNSILFGKIQTARTMRQLQLGLRLVF